MYRREHPESTKRSAKRVVRDYRKRLLQVERKNGKLWLHTPEIGVVLLYHTVSSLRTNIHLQIAGLNLNGEV